MINAKNVVQHELIGLPVELASSSNPLNKGIKGMIVDETTHTLVIEQNGTDKRIFKKSSTLVFDLPSDKRVEVEGSLLDGRPWDRIKERLR